MHFTTSIALSILAATGALAAPHNRRQQSTSIRVDLTDSFGTNQALSFAENVPESEQSVFPGTFTSVTLTVGADLQQQDLRCIAYDLSGNPIVVKRGANTDISFGDGGKGAWTFRTPSDVSEVICDPTFTKITDTDVLNLRVVLQSQSTETGSQTVLEAGARAEAAPIGSSGPFETVELRVGDLVQPQEYRCQVLDLEGMPIHLTRGTNKDTTFGDGGKGEWTFDTPSEVSSIVCDPTFKKAA